MRVIYLIAFAIIISSSTALAESVIGRYSAVTETEAVIELNLKKDHTAELITGYLPEEPDESFKPYVRYGKWSQREALLIIEIKDLGILRYKIMEVLPYTEFGDEGGSFGLSPDKEIEKPYNRYGLWRKIELHKHFNK